MDDLFDELVEAGQHPSKRSDTVTCLELIGQSLEKEFNRKKVLYNSQGHV